MKVLFINPSVGYYTRALSNPMGLLSIATYVKNNGHEVLFEDRSVKKRKNINFTVLLKKTVNCNIANCIYT